MKITKNDLYILGREAVDNIRKDYYSRYGSGSCSGAVMFEGYIKSLQRIKEAFEEIEKSESTTEDEYI